MPLYLISYDLTQNSKRDTAIYSKVDTAIQDLDENAEPILASQWLIESDDESDETIGKYILGQLEHDRNRINLVVNPIESGFAYPTSLRRRFLSKLL